MNDDPLPPGFQDLATYLPWALPTEHGRRIKRATSSMGEIRTFYDDGAVHAFHNMCSHRGNPVVWDSKGKCNAFTCKYHSWTYRLDGGLHHVPG